MSRGKCRAKTRVLDGSTGNLFHNKIPEQVGNDGRGARGEIPEQVRNDEVGAGREGGLSGPGGSSQNPVHGGGVEKKEESADG